MRRLNLAALLGVLIVTVLAIGCGGGEAEEEMIVIEPAVPIQIRDLIENQSGESTLVATIRGPGQIGYLQPRSRRDGNEMITTVRVQNNSTGALAAFKMDEFWYDRDGETVTGGSFRLQKPFMVGEVIEIELRVPRTSRMDRSNYEFSHKNGVIEATLFEEMDEATPIEEDEEEAEDAEASDS